MKYNERGKSRIEVSDILNYFKDIDSYYNDCTRYDTLKRMLEDIVAETKEDAERKTGRWILPDTQRQEDVDNGNYQFICSECGKADIHSKAVAVSFCWNCGARLEGEG